MPVKSPIRLKADCVLLDVEGTTSSISFVHDVMFPYARRHAADFITSNWNQEFFQKTLELLAGDCGEDSLNTWLGNSGSSPAISVVIAAVNDLMDRDAKVIGLKTLQGMIWKSGFESGELVAHLFEDVAPAMKRWHASGVDLRIYSSGSIQAQKLFFGHTIAGDLLHFLSAHYDTSVGNKRESASYTRIATDSGMDPGRIVFLSDVPEELDAARAAGMQGVLCVRDGNQSVHRPDLVSITSFALLDIQRSS